MTNGYYAHALELDDTHDGAVLHAGASAVPAAFAAAELRGDVSGAELLNAIAVGIEITCRLGVATKLSLVEGGWIYSSLLAHFGAAVSACKILANSEDALRRALGMAYVLTCGNHQSTRESAETKHLQPAVAGSNGLLAALLAGTRIQINVLSY
jgi:2-methylcitrate dehydratase PrpD